MPQFDVDAELLELMRLRVAAVHQCAYCGTVRTQAATEEVAPIEDAVFGEEIDTDPLTRREALAVRLADEMSKDPSPRPRRSSRHSARSSPTRC